MDPLTQLGLLATIAATYSGFIAVFIVLAKDGRFETADAHFVQAMVLGTIGVIVMALAPPVLVLMMPADRMWLAMTIFAILGGVPTMIYQAIQQSRLSKAEAVKVPLGWHIPGWALGFLALAAFAAALLVEGNRPGLYVAGVTLMLSVSIWCFIAVVFRKFF
jgi:hypothetical protein